MKKLFIPLVVVFSLLIGFGVASARSGVPALYNFLNPDNPSDHNNAVICQQDPKSGDCLFWVSELGDVTVPWESNFIVSSGPGLNAPSGGHFQSRYCNWLGRCAAIEIASLEGFALIENHKDGDQRNIMEARNPLTGHEGAYFPQYTAFGTHAGQDKPPQSTVHVQRGYLQLEPLSVPPPEEDCIPDYHGRLAVVGSNLYLCNGTEWLKK